MREVKTFETIAVIKYRAFDDREFDTKEECLKYEKEYEKTLGYCRAKFLDLCVDKEFFAECDIYENFGYGSEEYKYAVIEIKNEEDIKTVLDYYKCIGAIKYDKVNWEKYIGKKILVGAEYDWGEVTPNPRTKEELINYFKKEINRFFKEED